DPEALDQLGLAPKATRELRDRLYRLFLAQTPEQVEAIRQAVSESNWALLISTAHAMKSSCLQLGAQRLGERCEALEYTARARKSVDPTRLAAFMHEWEHARAYVEHELAPQQ